MIQCNCHQEPKKNVADVLLLATGELHAVPIQIVVPVGSNNVAVTGTAMRVLFRMESANVELTAFHKAPAPRFDDKAGGCVSLFPPAWGL